MSWLKDVQKNVIGIAGGMLGVAAGVIASPIVVAAELLDGKGVDEALSSAGTVIEKTATDMGQFGYDHAEDIVETTGVVIDAAKILYDATKPKSPYQN